MKIQLLFLGFVGFSVQRLHSGGVQARQVQQHPRKQSSSELSEAAYEALSYGQQCMNSGNTTLAAASYASAKQKFADIVRTTPKGTTTHAEAKLLQRSADDSKKIIIQRRKSR